MIITPPFRLKRGRYFVFFTDKRSGITGRTDESKAKDFGKSFGA